MELKDIKIKSYVIGEENYKKRSQTHFHVFLELDKTFYTKNLNIFTLKKENVSSIPHYTAVNYKPSAINYCSKGYYLSSYKHYRSKDVVKKNSKNKKGINKKSKK